MVSVDEFLFWAGFSLSKNFIIVIAFDAVLHSVYWHFDKKFALVCNQLAC